MPDQPDEKVSLRTWIAVMGSILGAFMAVISAIKDMPMRPGVRLHSILGDRARGGPRNRSSDGVVPYASSHLLQAESEVIVPASHTGTLKRPETIAELVRILTSPSVMKRASSSTQN